MVVVGVMFIMFISSLMFLFSDSTTLALHDLQFEMISIYLTLRLTTAPQFILYLEQSILVSSL